MTNIKVERLMDAEKAIRCYASRWNIEDVIRLLKQTTKMEKFLVRGHLAIKRLNFLVFLARAFALTGEKLPVRITKWIEKMGECFNKRVDFIYYRVFTGLKVFFSSMRSSSFQRIIASFTTMSI